MSESDVNGTSVIGRYCELALDESGTAKTRKIDTIIAFRGFALIFIFVGN